MGFISFLLGEYGHIMIGLFISMIVWYGFDG